MNRKQVFHVLKLLSDVYPQFHLDQSKIDNWTRLLKGQNPAIIMRNTERYILENKYPPSLSEIRESNSPFLSNHFLKTRENWEREAVGHQPRG